MVWCTAHLDRKQVQIPAFKLGLCEACYSGKPIDPFEKVYSSDSPKGRIRQLSGADVSPDMPYCLSCRVSLPDEQIVAIHLAAQHEVTVMERPKYDGFGRRIGGAGAVSK